MTKKINLRGIKGGGFFPPQNCQFVPSFIIFKKYFPKKFKKNALDIIRVLFTDESITFDIVPQLKIFLDFSQGVMPFCKNTGSQKLDPRWNVFC